MISFSRGPSQSRDGTHVSCIAGGFFTLSYLGIDSYKWINHTCCMGLWWDFEWSSNDDGDDVDGCHLWSISVRYKAECFMFYHLILTIALWGFIIPHNHPHHHTLILAISIIGLQIRKQREKLSNLLQSLSDDQQSCILNSVSLRVQLLHYCLPLLLYHWRDKGGRGIVDRLKWNKCICVAQRRHASCLEPGGGGWLGVCTYVLASGK